MPNGGGAQTMPRVATSYGRQSTEKAKIFLTTVCFNQALPTARLLRPSRSSAVGIVSQQGEVVDDRKGPEAFEY
jgi:hypothetical protein